jgi:uncharacterized cupin superfamily protein
MHSPRPKNIIHEDDLPWAETRVGERNAARRRRFGPATGLEQLGASIYELAPGKRAFPRHWHTANEEFLYILAGTGSLQLGDQVVTVVAGDFIALPAGAAHAHQLANQGTEPLRYFAVSTMNVPDVVHYPDSNKLMTIEGRGPDGKPLGGVYPEAAAIDYWTGEE